jgi:hypothetical protein
MWAADPVVYDDSQRRLWAAERNNLKLRGCVRKLAAEVASLRAELGRLAALTKAAHASMSRLCFSTFAVTWQVLEKVHYEAMLTSPFKACIEEVTGEYRKRVAELDVWKAEKSRALREEVRPVTLVSGHASTTSEWARDMQVIDTHFEPPQVSLKEVNNFSLT